MATSWARTGDIITIDVTGVHAGTEMWMLLRSDAHHDSKGCDRRLEMRHLEQARDRGALILDFGDLFDAMQTRTDPRRSTRDLKAEFLTDSYLNAIVNEAAQCYSPYAPQWVMMGTGNHEYAIQKHSDYDPISGLLSQLNTEEHGGHILAGGYDGYVKVRLTWKKVKPDTSPRSESFLIYYTHGSGGSARRSKGMLKADLRAAVRPDADIIVSAHIHSSWQLPMIKERVTKEGTIREDLVWHLQLPSYKRPGTWESTKEMNAHPLGAHWLNIKVAGNGNGGRKRAHIEPRWGLD